MIEFYKQRGETPLEALNRLRIEQPEFANETLSYAGRLDPMAEGILPVLVGEDENKNRQEFLNKDKEYYVELIIGYQSDTGDVLGVIQKDNSCEVLCEQIKSVCKDFIKISNQTYPWYSSKTVDGIPLFVHAQNKNFSIKRPTRDVKIYLVKDIECKRVSTQEIVSEIVKDISKVKGDFRQGESIVSWQNISGKGESESLIVSFSIQVSSGTYVRALSDQIFSELGVHAVVTRLIRTQIL